MTQDAGGESNADDIVRFDVTLPKEACEALEQLRQLTGKKSLAETIRAALQLYLEQGEQEDAQGEWEVKGERVVKWNAEQTRHLRERLASVQSAAGVVPQPTADDSDTQAVIDSAIRFAARLARREFLPDDFPAGLHDLMGEAATVMRRTADEATKLSAERDALRAEVARLQAQIEGHAARIIRDNAAKDPAYCPYCLRCTGLVRMQKVETLYWRCRCGAECDLRGKPVAAVTPDALRTAEVRGVRAGLETAWKTCIEVHVFPGHPGDGVAYRKGLRDMAVRLAEVISAIDPSSVAVGGPGEGEA